MKNRTRLHHADLAHSAYALPVFLLFLGGVMLRLTLRRLPLPSCAAQQAVLLSASLSAAAYLSAASVYGLVFLPLI